MSLRSLLALLIMLATTLSGAPRILVHGHRGARAVRPENTIPAFEYAIEAGADVLELDLAVTRDNVLVVSHDPTLNHTICSSPGGGTVIHELTFEEVRRWDCGSKKNPAFPKQQPVPGARMPSLDEVFALAGRGRFEFNIETKIFKDRPHLSPPPEEFARLVVEAVRKHKLESRVILQSFDFRTLQAAARLAPEIRRSALFEGLPRDIVKAAVEAGANILSPHQFLVTRRNVDSAHRKGLQVVPWTANTPKEWERLVEAGADAIISDDPAELIGYLRLRGHHK